MSGSDNDKAFWKGFHTTWGVIAFLGVFAIFASAFSWAVDALRLRNLDDSDAGFHERSGFEVRRDALTGCEWLEADSGVVPRLRADGSQVCQ